MIDQVVVDLRPGEVLDHEEEIWQQSIVVVVSGEIDVRCSRGGCHTFRKGNVVTFAGLPLVAVRACGRTRLHAIRRITG